MQNFLFCGPIFAVFRSYGADTRSESICLIDLCTVGEEHVMIRPNLSGDSRLRVSGRSALEAMSSSYLAVAAKVTGFLPTRIDNNLASLRLVDNLASQVRRRNGSSEVGRSRTCAAKAGTARKWLFRSARSTLWRDRNREKLEI